MNEQLETCREAVRQMDRALIELRGVPIWGAGEKPSLYESYLLAHRVLERVDSVPSVWLLDMLYMLDTPAPSFNELPLTCGRSFTGHSSWMLEDGRLRKDLPRSESEMPNFWPAFPGQQKCELCDKVGQGCYVDHCHMTHRVRGLLCYSCNRSVNALTSPFWILRAQDSTEKYYKSVRKRDVQRIISRWRLYIELRKDFPYLEDPKALNE